MKRGSGPDDALELGDNAINGLAVLRRKPLDADLMGVEDGGHFCRYQDDRDLLLRSQQMTIAFQRLVAAVTG